MSFLGIKHFWSILFLMSFLEQSQSPFKVQTKCHFVTVFPTPTYSSLPSCITLIGHCFSTVFPEDIIQARLWVIRNISYLEHVWSLSLCPLNQSPQGRKWFILTGKLGDRSPHLSSLLFWSQAFLRKFCWIPLNAHVRGALSHRHRYILHHSQQLPVCTYLILGFRIRN